MAIKFVDKPPDTGMKQPKKPSKAPVALSPEEVEAEASAPPAKPRGRPAKAATAKEESKTAKPAKSKWKRG